MCSVVYNVDGPNSGNFKPFRRDVKTALTPLAPLARRSKTANRGRLGRKASANIFFLLFLTKPGLSESNCLIC